MRSKNLLLSVLGLTGLLYLAACGSKETPTHVLLPEMLPSGGSTLSEVQIQTLSDPKVASGPAAVVYASPILTRGGFTGGAAEPHLSESGRVWIPMDVSSSSALSVYYAFEKLQQFERSVFPKSMVSWPRKVAFDFNLLGGSVNNAFYTGQYDVTAIVPYNSGGLPVAFNSGIIAHEHFHAHFHALFARGSSEQPELHLHGQAAQAFATGRCGLDEKLLTTDKSSPEFINAVNETIYRSWNEGLADFYAALVTGSTNFFDESLPGEGRRDVGVRDFTLATRYGFETRIENDLKVEMSIGRRSESCESLQYAYRQGSQVARLTYAYYLTKFDESSPSFKEDVAKDFFARLFDAQDSVKVRFSSPDLQPSWILTQLGILEKETPPINAASMKSLPLGEVK